MFKRACILSALFLLLAGQTVWSQTFAEWFNQGSTQKKYLLTQIALLQTYLGYVQKGYEIARSGLSSIHDIKNGEYDLHSVFYSSLLHVNPNVRNYSGASAILSNESYIMKNVNELKSLSGTTSGLPDVARQAISLTTNRVSDDCDRIISELSDVVTDGKLSMTDAERIKRIKGLYTYSCEQVAFIQEYRTETAMLIDQRRHEEWDIQEWELFEGIK
jgi:hypothetical protein